MRIVAVGGIAVVCAACAAPPAPVTPSSSSSTPVAGTVNPSRIERVRQDLPPDYEVGGIDPGATSVTLWGLGSGWTAQPGQCAALAAPAVDPATTRGWSASGPGGTVYATVARTATPPDPALPAQCDQWSVTGGHTSGQVHAAPAPVIESATTTGMAVELITVVEGGTETHLHADTLTADLGDYVVVVTVVVDPGSPNPPLEPDFGAGLLAKTVSALRG